MNVSVVVPVFNGARSLPPLVARLADALPVVADRFEVVLVNDGSADGSWAEIEALAERFAWVRGIDLARNHGQHAATLCGIRHARHDVIVTMDDDLEHPPEAIAALLRRLDEGHDVVYGTAPPPPRGWARGVGRAIMRPALFGPLGRDAVEGATSFRAFPAAVRDAFPPRDVAPVFIDLLLARGTRRPAYVAVDFGARHGGASGYSLPKLVARSLALLAMRLGRRRARGPAYVVRRYTGPRKALTRLA